MVKFQHDRAAYDNDGPGPIRTCALTRRRLPRSELVRFAAAPNGLIVPDLASKLPGRGVWLSCNKDTIASAVAKKVFARSLKRAAYADAGLPDLVESLMLKRLCDALSIVNKAGAVLFGFTKIELALGADLPAAILHACDASEAGAEKLDRRYRAIAAQAGRLALSIKVLTTDQLSLAFGRANVVHAAVGSGGATDKFLFELERFERYRSGKTIADAVGPTGLRTPAN